MKVFYQRLPYVNDNSACSNIHQHALWHTRFISLAGVTSSKDKSAKWLHALSIDPAAVASTAVLEADPSQMHTPCPYQPVPVTRPPPPPPPGPPPKKARLDAEEFSVLAPTPPPPGGGFFFGDMGVARQGAGGGSKSGLQQQPPSADARTLFVGGVSNVKDHDFHTAFGGIVSVKQPPGKNFAFVEFESHAAALAVMTSSTSPMGVSVRGRPVSVGWAAGRQGQGSSQNHYSAVSSTSLQSAPINDTCRSLFVAGLSPFVEDAKDGAEERALQQHLLTLFKGAQRVHRLGGKTFAFVDFDSHASTAAAMEEYASSPEAFRAGAGDSFNMLSVGWSKSGGDNKSSSGDAKSSCWFCLASPTAKV